MKRTFILMGVVGSLIGLPDARGQSISPSTLNSCGGTAVLSSNTYDWSVGEMAMVSTFTGSSVIVTQGLLQPDSIITTTGVSNTLLSQHLRIFPNPASSLLNIELTASSAGAMSYRLLDMTGKVIISNERKVPQGISIQQIDIKDIAVATYMLEVYFNTPGNSQEMNTFKIEKLK